MMVLIIGLIVVSLSHRSPITCKSRFVYEVCLCYSTELCVYLVAVRFHVSSNNHLNYFVWKPEFVIMHYYFFKVLLLNSLRLHIKINLNFNTCVQLCKLPILFICMC